MVPIFAGQAGSFPALYATMHHSPYYLGAMMFLEKSGVVSGAQRNELVVFATFFLCTFIFPFTTMATFDQSAKAFDQSLARFKNLFERLAQIHKTPALHQLEPEEATTEYGDAQQLPTS